MRQRCCECIGAGHVIEVIGGAQRKCLGDRCWPKIIPHFHATCVRCGHISDAHFNYLSVRFVREFRH